ncbi:MAG: glutaredoxin domain-containing protein [Klebsiella pneumoniae]|nr:glutaredoxin domain-containing protein [Klebsiella pneumoniae]
MANIEIYTKATCPFCIRAKALLNSKGVTFHDPQIFIDAQHIGGCDDLYALDSRGGLDPLLR